MGAMTARAVLIIGGLAGFTGGALATWLLLNDQAVAQDTAKVSPPIVSAQEFRLVDEQGTMRAMLGISADGEPYLAMLHRNNTQIIWLGLAEESGLAIRDMDGKTRLILSLDTSGEPSLILRDRRHRTRSITP
ncbi:MAG: hypothetical protein KatS3mg082_2109 [Nitrospiraceae bacterium]|nr:MAG: hypothetical protein KatS3mg082_2109 [Nitrospiraceae bacterium]